MILRAVIRFISMHWSEKEDLILHVLVLLSNLISFSFWNRNSENDNSKLLIICFSIIFMNIFLMIQKFFFHLKFMIDFSSHSTDLCWFNWNDTIITWIFTIQRFVHEFPLKCFWRFQILLLNLWLQLIFVYIE